MAMSYVCSAVEFIALFSLLRGRCGHLIHCGLDQRLYPGLCLEPGPPASRLPPLVIRRPLANALHRIIPKRVNRRHRAGWPRGGSPEVGTMSTRICPVALSRTFAP